MRVSARSIERRGKLAFEASSVVMRTALRDGGAVAVAIGLDGWCAARAERPMEARLGRARAGSRGRPPLGQRHPEVVVEDDDRAPLGLEAPEARGRARRGRRRRTETSAIDGPSRGVSSTSMTVDGGAGRRRCRHGRSVDGARRRTARGRASPGRSRQARTIASWTASRASSAVPEDQAGGRVQPRDGRAGERGEGVMIAPPRPLDEPSLVHGRLGRVARPLWSRSQGMATSSRELFPSQSLPAEGSDRDGDRPDPPQGQDNERPADVADADCPGPPGTPRRGHPTAAGREQRKRIGQPVGRHDDPAEQQESEEQAVGEGEGRLGAQRAGQQRGRAPRTRPSRAAARRRGAAARPRCPVASRGNHAMPTSSDDLQTTTTRTVSSFAATSPVASAATHRAA